MSKRRIGFLCLFTAAILLLFFLSEFLWRRNEEKAVVSEETATVEAETAADDEIEESLKAGNLENLKVVFLTFDGSLNDTTTGLVNMLKNDGAVATFFIDGENINNYSELLKQIISDGNAVGNTTISGDPYNYEYSESFTTGVNELSASITEITGTTPELIFRFPEGSMNAYDGHIAALKDLGYSYFDWDSELSAELDTPEAVKSEFITDATSKPAAVIMADLEAVDAEFIEGLNQAIKELKEDGYTFMTVKPEYPLTRFRTE